MIRIRSVASGRYGLFGLLLLCSDNGWAQCRIDSSFSSSTSFLVNGLIHQPVPEIIFDLPGATLGAGGSVISTTVNDRGGGRTLSNHVRFRLRVKNQSSFPMLMQVDSSTGLSCTNCASNVVIPFTKLGWREGISSTEKRGSSPGSGYFTGSTQTWIHSNTNQDHIFNLQFDFQNDEIFPAGAYSGRFMTRALPN